VEGVVIIVRLTRQELLDAGANCDGLQVFDVLARRQSAAGDTLTYEWTQERQIWCLLCEDLRRHVGWLSHRGLLPRICLRGADLRWANLYESNLYRANLCEANLYESNLYRAYLCEANLYGADLCGADLRWANLYRAHLCRANLCEANLDGADLYGANLRGADLRGADLRGADLRGVWRFSDDAPIPGWELHDGKLRRTS
jgi:uncharacterized protein YjbI with pentapeptide repeats